jgi:hypothetical protein
VERPGRTEVLAVLAACAVLFVVIAKLDGAAADRVRARAATAAAQVDRAPARAAAPSKPAATGVALAGGVVAETAARSHPAATGR